MLQANLERLFLNLDILSQKVGHRMDDVARALEDEERQRSEGDERSESLVAEAFAGGLSLEFAGAPLLALGIVAGTATGEFAYFLGASVSCPAPFAVP